jgi:hypothetical protein
MKVIWRILSRIALGVWKFVVGDTPEFLVVVLLVVGFALAVHRVHLAIILGLPAIVAVALASSVRHAHGSSRRAP